MRKWGRLRASIAAVGMSLAAAPALADELGGDGQLYFAYRFGGGLEVGLEGRGTLGLHQNCQEEGGFGAAVARFSWLFGQGPRVVLGGQGGRLFHDNWTVAAEVAGVYEWTDHPGFGMLLGVEGGFIVAPVRLDVEVVRRDPWLGAGLRLPPPAGTCIVEGRTLHEGCGAPLALAATDDERAHLWAGRARHEWDSVPAFLELAAQLRAAGAPVSLERRAYRAAAQEVGHALLSARVAAERAGGPIALGANAAKRRPLTGAAAIHRLAMESWLDGCLGEGAAAATAAVELATAEDPLVRAAQTAITIEEADHAALAWDILAWSTTRGGDDVRHAIWKQRDAVFGEVSDPAVAAQHEAAHARLAAAL